MMNKRNKCLGRGQSKLWLSGTAISMSLFYLLILPMELYFFGIWVPSLLGEHNERLRDPTLIKQFPFKSRLPSTAASYLARMHPALADTEIHKYIEFGGSDEDRRDDVFANMVPHGPRSLSLSSNHAF